VAFRRPWTSLEELFFPLPQGKMGTKLLMMMMMLVYHW
jgi:hypothetical protein